MPSKGETAVYTDTRLKLTFDAAPVLGARGIINIYKQSDDTLIDTIDLATRHPNAQLATRLVSVDAIGKNVQPLNNSRMRFVFYTPIKIDGNTATIIPHTGVLLPDTAYYVTIDAAAFTGKIGGANFAGINKASGWSFTTKSAPTGATVTVDDDGAADFRTVQGAINYMMHTGSSSGCAPACPNAAVDKTINIKNGTYDEMLLMRNLNKLTINGESRAGVVVQNANFDSLNPGVGGTAATANAGVATGNAGGGRALLLIEGGDEMVFNNFTMRNLHVKAANLGNQAEVFYFNGQTLTGSRLSAKFMNIYSTQDTINTKGWVWFYKSTVSGDVDFIWGSPWAALFEESEIRTVVDTTLASSGGYVVQSRAQFGFPGFVFLNSTLTAEAGIPAGATYLARNGGSGCDATAKSCDNIAYINTKMGPHIAPAGWSGTPNPAVASDDAGWREYASTDANGAALDISKRAATSIQVSPGGYTTKFNTRAKVFSQFNNNAGWNPQP
ncbi:MAG: pectate lyase [Massilia sp.]